MEFMIGSKKATGMKKNGKPSFRYLEEGDSYVSKLAKSGYTTGIAGKWHLGASDQKQQSGAEIRP